MERNIMIPPEPTKRYSSNLLGYSWLLWNLYIAYGKYIKKIPKIKIFTVLKMLAGYSPPISVLHNKIKVNTATNQTIPHIK